MDPISKFYNDVNNTLERVSAGYLSLEKIRVVGQVALLIISILALCGVASPTLLFGTAVALGALEILTSLGGAENAKGMAFKSYGNALGITLLVLGSLGLSGHLTAMQVGIGVIGTHAIMALIFPVTMASLRDL